MTRRQKRYEKRKALRTAARKVFYRQYDSFDIVCDRQNLFDSADAAKKHVMWKGTVQRWSIEQLLNTEKLYRDLKAGKDVRKGFSRFTIWERGKVRHISAVKFYERVVQKCLCRNILYPVYTKSLIYYNTASQKGKGTKFATDGLTTALRRFYRRHGTEGYALLADFKGYFENIDHTVLKKLYRRIFQDCRLIGLIDGFVDAYGEKGLGLGSETSQMHAIFYPDKIDHAITEHCTGAKYGRYMDDSFVLLPDKTTARKALNILQRWCAWLKITLSAKKTMIVPLKAGIKWLKTKFYILTGGGIIRKPYHASVVRERRRLKKQLKAVAAGAMQIAELVQSFESWAGSLKRRNARLTVWKTRQILWSKIQ